MAGSSPPFLPPAAGETQPPPWPSPLPPRRPGPEVRRDRPARGVRARTWGGAARGSPRSGDALRRAPVEQHAVGDLARELPHPVAERGEPDRRPLARIEGELRVADLADVL